jgi:hypothetical protein
MRPREVKFKYYVIISTQMDPDELGVVPTLTVKMFFCLNIPASLVVRVPSHPRFEWFVLRTNCPIEDLERSFSVFGGKV